MGDVADLTAKAYEITRMIPPGHVTTYGASWLAAERARLKLNMGRAYRKAGRIPDLLEVGLLTNGTSEQKLIEVDMWATQ